MSIIKPLSNISSSESLNMKNSQIKSTVKSSAVFRIRGKSLFLTYPRCGLLPEEVLSQLILKFKKNVIDDYVIARELHNDSENSFAPRELVFENKNHDYIKSNLLEDSCAYHIHACIVFQKPIDIKGVDFLALTGLGKLYRGDYRRCRSVEGSYKYLLKSFKEVPLAEISSDFFIASDDLKSNSSVYDIDPYERVMRLAEADQVPEALAWLRKNDPHDFFLNHLKHKVNLWSLRDSHVANKSKFLLDSFNGNALNVIKSIEPYLGKKSIFLSGNPGVGKSNLVRSFLSSQNINYLELNNYDSLRDFDRSKHTLIFFDDFPLSTSDLSREDILSLFDVEDSKTFKVRYSNVRIASGVNRIFTSNISLERHLRYMCLQFDDAVLRRIVEIKLPQVLIEKGLKPSS